MSAPNREYSQNDLLETQSPDFAIDDVKGIVYQLYGLTGKISSLDSERDQNFRIDTEDGGQFVIKVANSAEDPAVIEMQLKAIEHIALVDPELPVPKLLLSQNGLAIETIQAGDGTSHSLRIISYLPGFTPEGNPPNPALLRPMGACLARLSIALRGFFHPSASYDLLWDLKHAAKLREYLIHITDEDHHELTRYFLDRFEQNVLPQIPKFRAQIVHNDLTPDNILVAERDPGRVVGIIDFGDITHTLLIGDLATTIASVLRGYDSLIDAASELVAGYHEVMPLEDAELRVLYDLIAARLIMLNIIASWRVTLHPDNREYIMGGVEATWRILEAWRTLDPDEVTRKFFRVCNLWEQEQARPEPQSENETTQSLVDRRTRLLGACAFTFYDRPLHLVRGEGVWLVDAEGKRYLDAYNNVAHVGHSHPHVVKAIAEQARTLNTNTRYLHGLILDLAEQITSRMPESLSVCMFVCTGSEANELAWRMSKLASGNSGALVSKYAYHGGTYAISQFSTEDIAQESLSPHVQTFFAPTADRVAGGLDSGIDNAIRALADQGHRPAMLLLDSAFVSDGIYTSPNEYLKELYAKTRAAGGLCVADEVQSGFGRLGEHFWGFEFDDVIPDIVTLGKPMGNGHPIAAVVTRPEIAEVLANEIGYFNTFGGNPVSCAAGLAMLNVIEKESLQKNALEVGQYLRDQLGEMQKDHPVLGEVHGSGLLLGVDIIKPGGTPFPEMAVRIKNQLRENGVLIGSTGQHNSILKIRPPIVFQKEHANMLLDRLTKVLDEI